MIVELFPITCRIPNGRTIYQLSKLKPIVRMDYTAFMKIWYPQACLFSTSDTDCIDELYRTAVPANAFEVNFGWYLIGGIYE